MKDELRDSPEGSDARHRLPGKARCLPCAAIIRPLQHFGKSAMEAEHINSISNQLDDLAQRAAELRRYL